MSKYVPLPLKWQTLRLPGDVDASAEGALMRKLARILAEWKGTNYVLGQRMKGYGVFCTAFVSSVLDELMGWDPIPMPSLPQDISFHDPEGAREGLRWFLKRYPHDRIEDGIVQPADVIVTGPINGGPGHAMIVGPRENTIWHATPPDVHFTGFALPSTFRFHAAYRVRLNGC